MQQAFLGNKHLFKGLYLENNWDWDSKYPVIHVSFVVSSSYLSQRRLVEIIKNTVNEYAKSYSIDIDSNQDYTVSFGDLIRNLHAKYNQKVVILIDEYDKPILDVIDKKDEIIMNQKILQSFYSQIKENDQFLQFVFFAGVSNFSKARLLNSIDNLNDISLHPKYADICGYTQIELEDSFSEYIKDDKVDLGQLKHRYGGHNFLGEYFQKVYCPWDIVLFFSRGSTYYGHSWFEASTPSFLIKLIKNNCYIIPESVPIVVSGESITNCDIENISITALLLQTGYLTIESRVITGTQDNYVLTHPNLEVKLSFGILAEIGRASKSKF